MFYTGTTRFRLRHLVPALLLLFGVTDHAAAQCAGDDGAIEICDYTNPANQFVNLFAQLGGTPATGGTWSYPMPNGAYDPVTGMLDIWQLHLSGTYEFTYTVTGSPGCVDNTAVVTVIIGPYAGNPSIGVACSNDSSVNLFSFFIGDDPDPHQNGTWSDDNGSGALNGNVLDATGTGLGTYNFTYTVPGVGSCPATSETVTVTIHRKPEPGQGQQFGYCDNEDFSDRTNLNLQDILSGEDPFGIWNDNSGTGQITGFFDAFINLQEVVDTYGPGEYSYTYTVYPSNPICQIETATITFVIEANIDYTGATLVVNSDICEDEMDTATYQAILTQGMAAVPDGNYEFVYSITGPASAMVEEEGQFVNGMLSFPIDPELFPEAGDYTIAIVHIEKDDALGICPNPINVSDVLSIHPLPEIDDAAMTIAPVCQGEDAIALLTGSTLADGAYDMEYSLSGANTQAGQPIQITIAGGAATLTIPAALLPNAGTTTLTIIYVKSVATGCETTSTFTRNIVVNTAPNVAQLALSIQDHCQGEAIAAIITGLGNLTSVTATYSLSGANSATGQEVSLAVAGGTASFIIPSALLTAAGTTTMTVTGVANNANDCGEANTAVTDSFTITARPEAPTSDNVTFCAGDGPTIASLQPSGADYQWFADAATTTPLADTTPLVTDDYFVSYTDPDTGCTSDRTQISVGIIQLPPPTLLPDGASFCGIDNPTLATLSANLEANGPILWYDAAQGGNLLPDTTLLEEGVTYFGFDTDPVEHCQSDEALAVTVTLTDCDPDEYEYMIPDGFSPNGDGVNDTFRIPEIEFLYPGFRLEIYNRYGNLLFTGNSSKPAWDGRTSEGSNIIDGVAPNGVYFYVVYFNKDNKGPKQGRLYLNR